ncbi:hypothetical protein ACFWTE_01220 [Nocardiopsis sp. NPDC058631]|uniref:hypothetical protein n=1 Tax=Nocardiopsis sp. NPDC058631 TaxID=3346566 RepID=UPI00364861C5
MSPSEPPASGPAGRRRKNSESDEVSAERYSRTGGRRRAGGRRKQESAGRRGRPLLVVAGVAVVALAVLGTVVYLGLGDDDGADQAAQQTRPVAYRVIDTGRMNDVLASRETDSRALNAGELFESRNAEISSQEIDFVLRDADLNEDCSAAVWGEQIQAALADADCTQAGRATYVSETYFGVTAVFNLADVEGSRAVAAAMNPPEEAAGGGETDEDGAPTENTGFVLPPSGADPFDRLGQGYSASDAIVSGHYLVVVWVQPTGSDSVEERVSLSGPLVALANFRDPLYRRMVQLDDSGAGTDTGTQDGTVEEPAGTDGVVQDPAGTDGTVQDPAGTDGTVQDPAGTDGIG